MTKAQRRMVREIKNHCKYSELGYLDIRDKRRFETVGLLAMAGEITILSSTENHIRVTV